METRLCTECREVLPEGSSKLRLTCSMRCYRRRAWARAPMHALVCVHCNDQFESKVLTQRYCSHRCARTSTYTPRPKIARALCEHCGENEVRTKETRFCSRTCFQRHRTNQILDRWLKHGESLSDSDGTLSNTAKNYLLAEAGHKCTQCGWGKPNPVLGRPILCIDHIDGDYRNNVRANLRVLCVNCHTLTPTFGALNIGTVSPRSVTSRDRRGLRKSAAMRLD